VTTLAIPAFERVPCRKQPSQGEFNHLVVGKPGRSVHRNRQTSLDGFAEIGAKFLHRLALSGAPGNGRHFGPKPALFGFVDDCTNLHIGVVEAAGVEPASEKVYRERLRAFPIRWF